MESKKLTELTVLAREALRQNQEKLGKAEKILQLAELGRKLETEREKVQPFYESTVKLGEEEEAARTKSLEETEEFKTMALGTGTVTGGNASGGATVVGEWGHLENFHKKYNKVLLDKLAIDEEKKRLQKENGDLRSILKQYLDGKLASSPCIQIC